MNTPIPAPAPSGEAAAISPGRRSVRRAKSFYKKVVADPIITDIESYKDLVQSVRALDLRGLEDAELAVRFARLRDSVRQGGKPAQPVEIEIYALAVEASRRALGLDLHDVQIIAGAAMADGRIAELATGEGKTLAAVLPAARLALEGRGVHVLTFNDYLARRDAAWMGPIYRLLGLSVGCVQESMPVPAKRAAYAAEITYATAKEAGFDFLRDGLAYEVSELVHRPFFSAIVDEADSIMIDEARIPLVIAGMSGEAAWDARRLAGIVRGLALGRDYETDAEHRNVFLTEAGTERLEAALGIDGLYEPDHQGLLEAANCALHAQALLRRDVDYIVRSGRIEIIDEFTGRVVDKRHWPDGLQAAVEAKEGLERRSSGRILGSITLQHFFKLYPRLAGMTATARSSAAELKEFYGTETVVIPPHRPSVRADLPDDVFTHPEPKRRALIGEIRRVRAAGRPVLVGTASVQESEALSAELRAAGVACSVLNAKNDELEAGIIAEAGRPGAVTISTNMAGRGVDIRLGGADESGREDVLAAGGLYVIGTNRHESLRVDRQLRGRSGRQGDPGSTKFFISLEDDLFRHYGLNRLFAKRFGLQPQDGPLASGRIRGAIDHAQRIIEGQNFDIRRSLTKFSGLVELQRGIVQGWREEILRLDALQDAAGALDEAKAIAAERRRNNGDEDGEGSPEKRLGEDGADVLAGLLAHGGPVLFEEGPSRFGPSSWIEWARRAALFHLDRIWADHLAWIQDTRESIHLVSVGGQTPLREFQKGATDEFFKLEAAFKEAVASELRSIKDGGGAKSGVIDRLKGPSSTWTYLVNEDQFGWGMDLIKPGNIGAVVASTLGINAPLFILTLLVRKIFRKKKVVSPNSGRS